MSEDLTLFSSPELKDVVQDMRELLSQSRLAFLLGAGCSKNAGLPLMPELTKEVLVHDKGAFRASSPGSNLCGTGRRSAITYIDSRSRQGR